MDTFADFHFIRPLWLLLIPVLLLAAYWLSRQGQRQTGFEQWIDADLLRHLVTDDNANNSADSNNSDNNNKDNIHKAKKAISRLFARPIYTLLAGAWLITCIALAGPTWEKLPQPLQQSEQAMVIILDLSPSMRATDNKPSRIVRARLKIKDLLSQRKDGLTALVVYAGEAHTVTPLTDDTKTIANLLSTLTPGLLPIPGSNIEMAMTMATTLVADSGIQHAAYVVLTDGIDPKAINSIERTLENQAQQALFIMGIGTPEGAPIPSDGSSDQSEFYVTGITISFKRRVTTLSCKQSPQLLTDITYHYKRVMTILILFYNLSSAPLFKPQQAKTNHSVKWINGKSLRRCYY